MTIQRKKLGRQGEDAAACYLEKTATPCCAGIIPAAWGNRYRGHGPGCAGFVEVRSRSSENYGLAQESVTVRKKLKLRQLAWQYLKAEGRQTEAAVLMWLLFYSTGRAGSRGWSILKMPFEFYR